MSGDCETLIYSTYIGGTDEEDSNEILVDPDGNAYVTGYTRSDDFNITSGAFDQTHGGNADIFLLKLNTLLLLILLNNNYEVVLYDISYRIFFNHIL